MDNNIDSYVDSLPRKLDINKKISLYKAVKKYCPNTVNKLLLSIYGDNLSKIIFNKEKKDRWYTLLINYLLEKEILYGEKTADGSKHEVLKDFDKYFINQTSIIYSLENVDSHLILYSETAKDFLIEAGLLDRDGNEIIKRNKPKKDNKKIEFHLSYDMKKFLKPLAFITLIVCIIMFIFFIRKYGLNEEGNIIFFTLLFTMSMLIIVN